MRVVISGPGIGRVLLRSAETLLLGRAPQPDPTAVALALPGCAPHVSATLGALVVGAETARLRWEGSVQAQLSGLFEAPGGARRVTLTAGMSALLDDGENHLRVLRGRQVGELGYADLLLVVEVLAGVGLRGEPAVRAVQAAPAGFQPPAPVIPMPGLSPGQRDWYVALALAEPWLAGDDDYPRPPSNREIYERVLGWHGYAWNLRAPQRVDDAIRSIAMIAFGQHDDPFRAGHGRVQNVRYAVGRRVAEVQLVTAADLAAADRQAAHRATG